MGDVLQTGREAFLSYLLSVGPESLNKLFASVADKTQQQVYQEAENSIAKQVVSIAGQEHKANTVISPLAKGAVAAALKCTVASCGPCCPNTSGSGEKGQT